MCSMPGFSFAEGGYVPLGPSGVTVANSEFGCVYFYWICLCAMDRTVYGCMGCMLIGIVGKLSVFLRVASVRDLGPHVWI
jgi:hypothetical protein